MTTRIFGSARYYAAALVILTGSLSMIGCDDAYSTYVQYTLRTDPLAMTDKFGDEQFDPDRPGVFPILSAKDVLNPVNPMSAKGNKLFVEEVLRDPTLITSDRVDAEGNKVEGNKFDLKAKLDEWFGTPRDPRVKDAPAILELDDAKLAEGSKIYRVYCMFCHGVNGDGRGVNAKWVNPHPRDFRQGMFKFQSVDQSTGTVSPPRREDLRRTIQQGIEGTSMPAFNVNLQPKEIDAVVSYVIHLSIRGQVEFDTIRSAYAFDRDANKLDYVDDAPLDEYMERVYINAKETSLQRNLSILAKWEKAQSKAIKIKPYPFKEGVDNEEFKASVVRGFHYFKGDETKQPGAKGFNCVSCHVNFGRQAMFKWDVWGTLVRPNNFTVGIFRGGRRTVDVYHRIHSGINGSSMPAFGKEEGNPQTATAVWDLVNFVQTMPYPAMREKLGIVID